MKRGSVTILIFAFALVLGMQQASATHDCKIMHGCDFLFQNVANVTADGHIVNDSNEYLQLCCRDVIMGQGVVSFKYVNNGHVSVNSSNTTFPNEFRMGFPQDCKLKDSCDNDIKEICIFRVRNESRYYADNSHVWNCSENIPGTTKLCCQFTEICSDGIENTFNDHLDCADWDCHASWANDNTPQRCTGSPYDSNGCVTLVRDTVSNTYTTTWNPACFFDEENTYYYCSMLEDNSDGYCCPSGQHAVKDPFSGAIGCQDTEPCGLKSEDPSWPCNFDFDESSANPANKWFTKAYAGDKLDWCYSKMPNLFYWHDNTIKRSDACCLMVDDGTVDYFTNDNNVKIYGTA